MNETLTLAPATLVVAVLVALLAASVASFPVRLSAGGTCTASRWVPGYIYFASVPTAIKQRRAMLDATTVGVTTFATLWFSWSAIPLAFVWAALAVACATDIRVYRLPHRLTRLTGVAAVAFSVMTASSVVDVLLALGAGLGFGLLFFAIGVASNGKLGMGDVYLALGCGVLAGSVWGLWGIAAAFVLTCFASLVVVLFMLVKHRGHLPRSKKLPFGPHIAIGTTLAVVLGSYASTAAGGIWDVIAPLVRL